MTLNRSYNKNKIHTCCVNFELQALYKNEKGARKAPLQMWLVANEARTAKGGPYIYYYKPSSDLKLIALEEVSEFTSES